MSMPPPPPWDPPPPQQWAGPAQPPHAYDPAPEVDRRALKRLATWSLAAGGLLGCVVSAVPGIVALMAAQKIGPAQHRGDGETARQLASRARTWPIVGFVAGAVTFVPMAFVWIAYISSSGST